MIEVLIERLKRYLGCTSMDYVREIHDRINWENQPNSYIAADDIEYSAGNKHPLWMFGLNY